MIEGSQIIVSRVVEKLDKGGDKSTYLVNGKTSSFTQVTTLLKDKGVDLDHKRFLILQASCGNWRRVYFIDFFKPTLHPTHRARLSRLLK